MSWSGSVRRRKAGKRWRRVRWAALKRDGWRCVKCGKAGVLEVDHILRIEDGGPEYDLANCQSLCRGCHVSKTSAERGIIPLPADWTALVETLTQT